MSIVEPIIAALQRTGRLIAPPHCRFEFVRSTKFGDLRVLLLRAIATAVAMSCVHGIACAADFKPIRVAEGVYALPGSGGERTVANQGRTANVAFIVGPRGVVVIDSGVSYREGENIIAAVRRVSSQPIRLVILTHPGQDVIFGATAFQEHGVPVLMHRAAAALVASRCEACLQNLKATLGDDVMAATRVVEPDRLIDGEQMIDLIERRLRLIAPAWSSTPGALAVLDERTSTLIAGNLVSLRRVPDTRDADAEGWRDALTTLRSTRCRHLVPTYGPPGNCADIDVFARYFIRLENHVAKLIQEGVGLAELNERCDLPEYADWDQYEPLHRQNANRTYVRLERALFEDRTPGTKR